MFNLFGILQTFILFSIFSCSHQGTMQQAEPSELGSTVAGEVSKSLVDMLKKRYVLTDKVASLPSSFEGTPQIGKSRDLEKYLVAA